MLLFVYLPDPGVHRWRHGLAVELHLEEQGVDHAAVVTGQTLLSHLAITTLSRTNRLGRGRLWRPCIQHPQCWVVHGRTPADRGGSRGSGYVPHGDKARSVVAQVVRPYIPPLASERATDPLIIISALQSQRPPAWAITLTNPGGW